MTVVVSGLFSNSHMSYELERDKTPRGQPSLADMTEKAIQVLQKNERGFFLLVEGKIALKAIISQTNT